MSRFNTLFLADATEVADALADGATKDELRIALINALRRIDKLEDDVIVLRRQVRDNR